MRKLTLVFDNIPDKAFIPVLIKRDIVKARILTHSEKMGMPGGSSDVQIESILGYKRLVSRKEILRDYRYLNGKKVKLAGWRNGKAYTVMSAVNTRAVAMMLPVNCVMSVGNKRVNNSKSKYGDYVICVANAEGNIDRSTASVVSRNTFRKMFSVLPNEVIEKNKGSKNSLLGRGRVESAEYEEVSMIDEFKSPSKLESKNNITVNKTNEGVTEAPIGAVDLSRNNIDNKPIVSPTMSGTKLTTIGKLLNSENKIVGFIVKDNKGMTRQVSKKDMIELCSRKLVDNIIIATREPDGAKYLRGNGIKIDSLSPYYL